MKISIISVNFLLSTLLMACSTGESSHTTERRGSILEQIPIVYRQDIQQGNVITQEMVNQLHPGLSKSQVRFIMGTPMLMDVFHESRWDYIYNMTHGWGETEQTQVHVFFKGDQLERVEGDFKPDPNAKIQVKQELVVNVPDYQDPNRGVIKQVVEGITGAFSSDTPPPSATPQPAQTQPTSP